MKSIIKEIESFSYEEFKALDEFKRQGGKVAAVFCRQFPSSLLSGFGIWPLRVLSGATGHAESAGEKLVRPDVCPYCKSIIGNFLEKSSIHEHVDIVVGLITCDQMRRTLERLSADLKLPVFPVQLPATDSKESEEYYIQGVINAIQNISSYLNKEIDINAVRKDWEYRVEAAEILAELMWKCRVLPLITHRLNQLYAWARPSEFLKLIKELAPKLPEFKPNLTVITTGSVLCNEDDTLIKILSERNVCSIPLNCTGLNMVEGLESVEDISDEELMPALSRIIYRMPSCIRVRSNKKVYDRIGEALEKTEAKGIILKALSFCDLWYTEKERMKRSFDVPVLVYDSTYGEGDIGRASTRIETFLEALS